MSVFKLFHIPSSVCLELFNVCQFFFLYLDLVHRSENLVPRILAAPISPWPTAGQVCQKILEILVYSQWQRPTAVRKNEPTQRKTTRRNTKDMKSNCPVYRANSKLLSRFHGLINVFLVAEILGILREVLVSTREDGLSGSLLPFLCKLCEQIFLCLVHQHGGNANHL